MRRGTVQLVALVTLLVQGVLGSVAPVAVLCMHQGPCEYSPPVVEEVAAASCGLHGCCQSRQQQEDPQQDPTATHPAVVAIALAPPCGDDCQSCVDVALPDLTLALPDRTGIQIDHLDPPAPLVVMVVSVDSEHFVPRLLPPATGPPDHLACVHAPILRSTRLLI